MTRQKVEDWLEGDNLTLLKAWARNGLSDSQLATNIGIDISTLYRWKKKNREFCDTLKRSKEVVDTEVENALYQAAIGGNTTAMIFWLKNRNPKMWREKQEEMRLEEGAGGGVIMIPEVDKRE